MDGNIEPHPIEISKTCTNWIPLNTKIEEQTLRRDLHMNDIDWINRDYLDAFKKGDRAGLPFEGCTMFPQEHDLIIGANSTEIEKSLIEVLDECEKSVKEKIVSRWNEKRLQLALKSNQDSDESSIVDCFVAFADRYRYTTREQFVWDWVNYHQQHHGTGYGRTMRDHFALVGYVRRHGEKYPDLQSKVRKLSEIAADTNSSGNGCLPLCYPAYCYASVIGENPAEFVRYLTGFTHANSNALEAVTLLCSFIEAPHTITDFYADSGISDDGLFREKYCKGHASALNTLATAVKCAMKETEIGVLREGLRIGGDTDSTLATAMLLWALQQ